MRSLQTLVLSGILLVIIWGICGVLAAPVLAGGYYLPGRGVASTARGGAMTAYDEDLNSLWYNPANLSGLHGTHLLGDCALISLDSTFQRTPRRAENDEIIRYDPVSNQSKPLIDPQLILATDFGVEKITLALGVMGPYSARSYYPEDGAQRYSIVSNDGTLLVILELALGVEIFDNLRIGAGLQNWVAGMKSAFMASAYTGLFGRPEDADLDLLVQVETMSLFNLSGNIGIWWEIIKGLQVALAFQFPVEIEDKEARLTIRLPEHYAFDSAQVVGDTLTVSLKLPAILRAGIRFDYEDVFDIELDGAIEFWSVHDAVHSDPQDIKLVGIVQIGELSLGKMSIPANLKNSFSLSLGGEYHIIPKMLTLRLGYAFETGAAPDETYSLFMVDSNKHHIAFGARFRWEFLTLDFSMAHIFQASRDIENSEIEQITPGYEDGALVVGNGTYDTSYNTIGLALSVSF